MVAALKEFIELVHVAIAVTSRSPVQANLNQFSQLGCYLVFTQAILKCDFQISKGDGNLKGALNTENTEKYYYINTIYKYKAEKKKKNNV